MSTFNETEHPRDPGGQFAAKTRAETDVTLPPPDTNPIRNLSVRMSGYFDVNSRLAEQVHKLKRQQANLAEDTLFGTLWLAFPDCRYLTFADVTDGESRTGRSWIITDEQPGLDTHLTGDDIATTPISGGPVTILELLTQATGEGSLFETNDYRNPGQWEPSHHGRPASRFQCLGADDPDEVRYRFWVGSPRVFTEADLER